MPQSIKPIKLKKSIKSIKVTIQNPRCLAEFAAAAANKIKLFLREPRFRHTTGTLYG